MTRATAPGGANPVRRKEATGQREVADDEGKTSRLRTKHRLIHRLSPEGRGPPAQGGGHTATHLYSYRSHCLFNRVFPREERRLQAIDLPRRSPVCSKSRFVAAYHCKPGSVPWDAASPATLSSESIRTPAVC